MRIDSGELLVSAFKKADSEDAIVLRVYNPKGEPSNPTKILITTPIKEVFECDFLEQNKNKIKCEHNAFITDVIRGYSAQTYKILIDFKVENI
ncbi:MAG: glycosyl hydrolase-related protein [Promethearchaeota archaeon]